MLPSTAHIAGYARLPKPEVAMGRIEPVAAYVCEKCDEIAEEAEEDLYECSSCGARFCWTDGWGHRCPECGRFSRWVADFACAACGEGEAVEVDAYRCLECGRLYEDARAALDCCP